MRMNIGSKKAQYYNIFITIGSILLFVLALTYLKPLSWNTSVGNRQFELMDSYKDLESEITYIEFASRFDLQQSLYEIGLNGGFLEESSCENTDRGYNIWNKRLDDGYEYVDEKGVSDVEDVKVVKEEVSRQKVADVERSADDIDQKRSLESKGWCLPDAKESIEKMLEQKLSERFSRYIDLERFKESYTVSIIGDKVYGFSSNRLYFPQKPSSLIFDLQEKIRKYGFDSYRIKVYSQVSCDEEYYDDSYNVEMDDNYFLVKDGQTNSGYKFIHADLVYKEHDQSDEDLLHKTGEMIKLKDIGEEKGKYCFSYNINPVYNIVLETIMDGEIVCSVSTYENENNGMFDGNDLKTWSLAKGQSSCEQSPTVLQCPGIKVYYCGKTGHESYDNRKRELVDWKSIELKDDKADERVSEYFVYVKEDDHAKAYHPHSKSALKFKVDIDKIYEEAEVSLQRDSWTRKWVEDPVSYLRTRIAGSGVKGEESYPFFVSVDPSFALDYDSRYERYDELFKMSEEMLIRCKDMSDQKLENCISSYLLERNVLADVDADGKIAELDIMSSKSVIAYDDEDRYHDDSLSDEAFDAGPDVGPDHIEGREDQGLRQIVYRFALDFS